MVQTTLRLPDELYRRLKETAKVRGMTLNAIVISVLWKMDYLFATEEDGRWRDAKIKTK